MHHPGQRPGRLDNGQPGFPSERILAVQRDDEIEVLVQYPGERVRRVQPDGAQHRQDIAVEITLNPARDRGLPSVAAQHVDALAFQFRRDNVIQHGILGLHQFMGKPADLFQGFHRAEVVGPGLHGTVLHLLLDAGDADLKKLIQVGAGDAEEFQSFQQRQGFIFGLGENAPVELQQA